MNTATEVMLAIMKRSAQASLGTLAVVGLVVGLSKIASAQTANTNPLQDFQSDNVADPFSNRGSNQVGGVMDIIHRAMQNNSQTLDDFNASQNENLDEATAAFKALQLQRLNNRDKATPPATEATPVPAPAPTTPNQ